MKVQTLNTVKYKGQYLPPRTEMDVEPEVAQQLMSVGAAVLMGAPEPQATPEEKGPEEKLKGPEDKGSGAGPGEDAELDPMEELKQVEGVDTRVANLLIEEGIDSIDALQAKSEEELAAIAGISKKRAKQIAADAAQFVGGE